MSAVTICANHVIRHLNTKRGQEVYSAALKAGTNKYGALCFVAKDTPMLISEDEFYDVTARAQAIRNLQ